MSAKRSVHVIGVGTIGEPVASILAEMSKELGAKIFFSKRNVDAKDAPKIKCLQEKGGLFATAETQIAEWRKIGVTPDATLQEAEEAEVIIDCAEGANVRKDRYIKELNGTKLFIAQGSEGGFGYPFALNIVSARQERFAWVVSCNTHNISSLIWTIAMNNGNLPTSNLLKGDFVLFRRSSDINQGKVIAAPEVDKHKDPIFGTHQAKDASKVFESGFGCEPLALFSTAFKTTNQFMHINRFCLTLKEETSKEEVIKRIMANSMLAVTKKMSVGLTFSFSRDHGYMGRFMNHSVIPVDTIEVRGNTVIGASFTPQDGNSLLSTIYLVLHYLERLDMMSGLLQSPYIFREV